MELSRIPFQDDSDLSADARYLFTVLNELEQRFCGKNNGGFFRTDEDLAHDCKWGITKTRKVKKELKDKAKHLIKISYTHVMNTETKKMSFKKFTKYEILQ